jgi:hypothetical protein
MQFAARALLHTLLANARAAGGALDPATVAVGLYTAIVGTPNAERVLGDLTEATFTGYARQAMASWTDPFNKGNGQVAMNGAAHHFTPTDAVTPNTILGWFIASAVAGGTLLAIESLDSPVPLANADHTLSILPQFAVTPTASFGESPEIN